MGMGCPDNANHSATRPFVISAARHFDASRETQNIQLRIKQHTICFGNHYDEANLRSMCFGRNLEKRLSGAVLPNFGALLAAYQNPQVEDCKHENGGEFKCNSPHNDIILFVFHSRRW